MQMSNNTASRSVPKPRHPLSRTRSTRRSASVERSLPHFDHRSASQSSPDDQFDGIPGASAHYQYHDRFSERSRSRSRSRSSRVDVSAVGGVPPVAPEVMEELEQVGLKTMGSAFNREPVILIEAWHILALPS